MRIYLIGFMGSGKSVIGRKLSAAMSYTFLDLDEAFETRYKINIHTFFQKYGEQEFRLLERKLLWETRTLENHIIATGGGTPCFFDNMDFIRNHGTAVYLKVSIPVLVQRLQNSRKSRPLLRGNTPESLEERIFAILEKRVPFYERAQVIVDEENLDIPMLQRILDLPPA